MAAVPHRLLCAATASAAPAPACAPNLVERIGNYTPRGFAAKVLTSYRIVPMPDGAPAEREAEREALLELVMKRERQ